MRLCLNLTREHVAKYKIDQNPYASVRLHGGVAGRYIVRFHDKKELGVHPWKISLNKKKSEIVGATLQLEPAKFKLDKDEKILGVQLDVESLDEGFVFVLDPDNFAPRPREVTKIKTTEDKVNAGFTAPSAWGQVVSTDVKESILQLIENHMFRKYGGKRA